MKFIQYNSLCKHHKRVNKTDINCMKTYSNKMQYLIIQPMNKIQKIDTKINIISIAWKYDVLIQYLMLTCICGIFKQHRRGTAVCLLSFTLIIIFLYRFFRSLNHFQTHISYIYEDLKYLFPLQTANHTKTEHSKREEVVHKIKVMTDGQKNFRQIKKDKRSSLLYKGSIWKR